MKLIKSHVLFNPDEHTYQLGDKELRGITSVIGRQLFPDKYRDVPEDVLRLSLIHICKASKQMEKTMLKMARNPDALKISDIETSELNDTLCILSLIHI